MKTRPFTFVRLSSRTTHGSIDAPSASKSVLVRLAGCYPVFPYLHQHTPDCFSGYCIFDVTNDVNLTAICQLRGYHARGEDIEL